MLKMNYKMGWVWVEKFALKYIGHKRAKWVNWGRTIYDSTQTRHTRLIGLVVMHAYQAWVFVVLTGFCLIGLSTD